MNTYMCYSYTNEQKNCTGLAYSYANRQSISSILHYKMIANVISLKRFFMCPLIALLTKLSMAIRREIHSLNS